MICVWLLVISYTTDLPTGHTFGLGPPDFVEAQEAITSATRVKVIDVIALELRFIDFLLLTTSSSISRRRRIALTRCRKLNHQAIVLSLLPGQTYYTIDGRRDLLPLLHLFCQLSSTGRGQFIIEGPSVILRSTPFRGYQALSLQSLKRWVEGTLVDLEYTMGDLFNANRKTPTVLRLLCKGF
jgi:hypothetical protein